MTKDPYFSLLSATSQGNKQAFAELYSATSGKLFALCLKILGNQTKAEDALQDSFVKIWHNAGEYQLAKGQVLTWMTSIVRYRCLDMLRQTKTRKEQPIDEREDNVQDYFDDFIYNKR